jgi:hypothetical protein
VAEKFMAQKGLTNYKDVGSSSLLVIQVHGSKMATSEEKAADWKTLMNQWRNEHSCRDELSHHLVVTKNDEEPGCFGEVCASCLILLSVLP